MIGHYYNITSTTTKLLELSLDLICMLLTIRNKLDGRVLLRVHGVFEGVGSVGQEG